MGTPEGLLEGVVAVASSGVVVIDLAGVWTTEVEVIMLLVKILDVENFGDDEPLGMAPVVDCKITALSLLRWVELRVEVWLRGSDAVPGANSVAEKEVSDSEELLKGVVVMMKELDMPDVVSGMVLSGVVESVSQGSVVISSEVRVVKGELDFIVVVETLMLSSVMELEYLDLAKVVTLSVREVFVSQAVVVSDWPISGDIVEISSWSLPGVLRGVAVT